jgi:hypothetical protein
MEATNIKGCTVRIKRGVCGEGYKFVVTDVVWALNGELQLYGPNYGPVRLSDVELLPLESC